ncbi:MAG: hypothetical protein AAF289_19900 [Cyanobacteria bacterium P01_A01_bin.135]
MTPSMVRTLWLIVERVQARLPLDLDDNSLSDWLVGQVRAEHPLNGQESAALDGYVRSRVLLIRDVVQT